MYDKSVLNIKYVT